MKRILLFVILLISTLSCQPPKSDGEGYSSAPPYNLSGKAIDQGFDLTWEAKLTGNISGYNIYASESSLTTRYPDGNYPESIIPVNHPIFPGDTDPGDGIEHFKVSGLENGHKYFLSVRVVYPDLSLSASSEEITVAPGPSGTMTLVERYKGETDGFSFVGSKHVRADATQNDIYCYAKNSTVYLDSPTRLDGFLNQTNLIKLKYKGSFEAVRKQVNKADLDPNKDRVAIKSGDWLLAKLASSNHVLIKVGEIAHSSGSDVGTKVSLEYYVCLLSGEILF